MKVSISLLTYNHERYIAQAIESVLMQRGIDWELIVSEDCSTDGTRAIVEEYATREPGRIRVLPAPRNVGMTRAFARGIEAARGEYVALLDGDDYWTSPDKLRLQAEYLDAHRECAICFHNATVVYDDGSEEPHPFHVADPSRYFSRAMPKPVSTLADIVAGNFVQTCSVMFRRGLFARFPEWYRDLPVADWPLHVLNAEHGDIGYLDATLAAYRVHGGGVWTGALARSRSRESVRRMADLSHTLERHLEGRFHDALALGRRWLYLEGARAAAADRRRADLVHFAWRYAGDGGWREPGKLLRAVRKGRAEGG